MPVVTNIIINDAADQATARLAIHLKENRDEWIEGEVNEYNDKGSLYKKLQYQDTGEVYKKMMYGETAQ